jgi:hypothetical protein
MKPPEAWTELALRDCEGVVDEVMDEYARFVPEVGVGDGRDAWTCCACAFARRRASSIRLTCSGVGGFGGSLPAERAARGGVAGLSGMTVRS